MQKISVVIITYNEERNIERCIQSVNSFADEILLVDSCSTDKTVAIAESLGAKVISQPFLGYSEQKNFANKQAAFDWIFSIDADEALSPELKEALIEVKEQLHPNNVYEMKRLNNYCGKWIRHCGWYPDKKIRLFNRMDAFWEGALHEKLILKEGAVLHLLNADLEHFPFYTFQDHIHQADKYSSISSADLYKRKRKASIFKLVFASPFRFFSDYILKLGFLDGYAGFQIAIISAFSVFFKYAKLRELYSRSIENKPS